jgi:hypothetical protein
MGATTPARALMGASGSSDVEPHCQCVGVLQQRSVDFVVRVAT